MILNYPAMEETENPQFQGGIGSFFTRMFNDGQNKILLGRLEPGSSIGMHCHETSSEIMFFLNGTGTVLCDGVEETVAPGLCHYCPKGHTHSLRNTGSETLCFYAVVPQQ